MRCPPLPSSLAVVGLAVMLSVSAPVSAISHASASGGDQGQDEPLTCDDYAAVFAIAHRGGRSLDNAERVIAAGADIVEIDVRVEDGLLVSSHDPVIRIGGAKLRPAPTLDEIWPALDGADAVLLDLKEMTPTALSLLRHFLSTHRKEAVVAISTPDTAALDSLATSGSDLALLQTVKDTAGLASTIEAEGRCRRLTGVSIAEGLVTADTLPQLHADGLLVVAWTVNDRTRVGELVRPGVDGIVTDSAAILALLGGAKHGERALPSQAPTEAMLAPCSVVSLLRYALQNHRPRIVPRSRRSKVCREWLHRTQEATDRHAPEWVRTPSSRFREVRDL